MADAILSPQDSIKDHCPLGKFSSMERHQNPNPNLDHSSHKKWSTRRFWRNARCDNKPIHGKQQWTMVLGPTKILKQGIVLNETIEDWVSEVDFGESEKKVHHQTNYLSKQVCYLNSKVNGFYVGLHFVDSPHTCGVPLPTFLIKHDDATRVLWNEDWLWICRWIAKESFDLNWSFVAQIRYFSLFFCKGKRILIHSLNGNFTNNRRCACNYAIILVLKF